jgi:hypothetical protein
MNFVLGVVGGVDRETAKVDARRGDIYTGKIDGIRERPYHKLNTDRKAAFNLRLRKAYYRASVPTQKVNASHYLCSMQRSCCFIVSTSFNRSDARYDSDGLAPFHNMRE